MSSQRSRWRCHRTADAITQRRVARRIRAGYRVIVNPAGSSPNLHDAPGNLPCVSPRAPRADLASIGLDVHRDFAQVAVWEDGEVRHAGQVEICGDSLRVFADSLGPEDEVAIEATCNTHAIVRMIEPRVERVVVSNPMKTPVIAEAKVKTDKVDAVVLAADYLLSVWVADEHTQALRRQVARSAQLVRQRTRIKNQVQAILDRNLVARCPFSDLFGVKGRCWLADQHLPADEQHAVEALLRQLDFHGQELRIIDAQLGRKRAGARGGGSADDDPRGRRDHRLVAGGGDRGLSPFPQPGAAGLLSRPEPARQAVRRQGRRARPQPVPHIRRSPDRGPQLPGIDPSSAHHRHRTHLLRVVGDFDCLPAEAARWRHVYADDRFPAWTDALRQRLTSWPLPY